MLPACGNCLITSSGPYSSENDESPTDSVKFRKRLIANLKIIAPYGDRGNDWLGLDNRKSQGTARHLGNREVVGRIEVIGNEDKLGLLTKVVRMPGRDIWATDSIKHGWSQSGGKTAAILFDKGFKIERSGNVIDLSVRSSNCESVPMAAISFVCPSIDNFDRSGNLRRNDSECALPFV